MKKILFTIVSLATVIVACNPVEIRDTLGTSKISESELLNALNVTVDKNIIHCNVDVAYPVVWKYAGVYTQNQMINATNGTFNAEKTGEHTVSCSALNEDGSITTANKTVTISEVSVLSDYLAGRLAIGKKGGATAFSTTFDPAKVIIEQEIKDGKKGNKVTVKNANPVLSDWDFDGASTADNNISTLFTLETGKRPLNLTYTKADGTTGTHTFTIDVEVLSYTPVQYKMICGEDGVKTWKWNAEDTWVYGNGSYLGDKKAAWWVLTINDIDGQAGGRNPGADGSTAKFTLNLNDKSIINNGTTGTFKIDVFDHADEAWDQGTLSFSGAYPPMCYLINDGDARPAKLYIMTAEEDQLVIAAPSLSTSGAGGEAWFWNFAPATE